MRRRLQTLSELTSVAQSSLLRVLFSDRIGLLIFLTGLLFYILTWRIGFFITDNWTLANALVSIADGQLHVTEFVYGPNHGNTPGMNVVDGRLYARNYGQLIVAVPFLWLLWGVSAVADVAIAISAAFSLLLLALFVQTGRFVGHETPLTYVGVVVALGTFALNVAFAVEVRPYWLPFAALQLSTMVGASLMGVVFYRLLTRLYGRRIGVTGGAIVVLASPIAFWSTIPKRHTITALLVVLTLYWFYRSRAASSRTRAIQFHALSYLPVGLLAWVHSAEGLALLGALVIADVASLRTYDPKRLAIVAGAFLVSLLPFLLTNWLISGDALTPPRLLPRYRGDSMVYLVASVEHFHAAVSFLSSSLSHFLTFSLPRGSLLVSLLSGSFGIEATVSTPTPAPADDGPSLLTSVVQWLAGLWDVFTAAVSSFATFAGLSRDAVFDADRLYHIFIRGGYLGEVASLDGQRAVSLSVLESMPVLGGLAALPVAITYGLGRRFSRRYWPSPTAARRDPAVAADIFVCCFTVFLVAFYLWRLPIHVSWTVRYFHPLYPLGLYALLRVEAIREPIERNLQVLAWWYVGTVLVGGQLIIITLFALEPTVSEAVQLHALLALVAASATAVWASISTVATNYLSDTDQHRLRQVGAVSMGLACGTTTTLFLFWAVVYFPHSQFALPVIWELAELLSFPT